MSKVYVVQVACKVDGKDQTLNVFIRAASASKALKSVAKVRRATAEDFIPETPPPERPLEDALHEREQQEIEASRLITAARQPIPSSTPEPTNE